MKTYFFSFLFIISINSIAQNQKTCNSDSEDSIDLNTISIKKCDVAEKTTIKTRSVYKKKNNNRISHYIRDKKNIKEQNVKKLTPEVLFSVVDEVPLFPKCNNSANKKCFRNKIAEHLTKNFHPEEIFDYEIKGRVFIQFIIDTKGNANDIQIQGTKKIRQLNDQIIKIIKKLPNLSPGRHKGLPVNVRYSLPLSFTTS